VASPYCVCQCAVLQAGQQCGRDAGRQDLQGAVSGLANLPPTFGKVLPRFMRACSFGRPRPGTPRAKLELERWLNLS